MYNTAPSKRGYLDGFGLNVQLGGLNCTIQECRAR